MTAPLFIFGHPRSGTTALASFLNRFPEVACLAHEGNLLYRVWQTLQRVDVFDEPLVDLLLDFEVTARHNLVNSAPAGEGAKVRFSEESLQGLVQVYHQGLQDLNDPLAVYHRVAREFFSVFARNSGCKIVADKVPDYLYIPEYVTAPFRDCRLMVTRRDPRAIIHSTLQFNSDRLHLFAVPDAFALAVSYCLKERLLNTFLATFPSHRLMRVEQDVMRSSPVQVLEQCAEFLGLDGLEQESKETGAVQTKNWRKEMSQENQMLVNAVCQAFDLLDGEGQISQESGELAHAVKELSASPVETIPTLAGQAALLVGNSEAGRKSLGFSLLQLADFRQRRGGARAASYFQEASAFLSHDPVFWYKWGLLCYEQKELQEAVACCDQCLTVCPPESYYGFLKAKAFYLRGMIQRLLGASKLAEESFRASLLAKPDFLLPKHMLAQLEIESQTGSPQPSSHQRKAVRPEG